jgi:phenylacetate-coenzyme A ligase PaaK-like adenylate-forming protein
VNGSEDLWGKYCSFFEKSFSEQLEHNEKKLKEYFEKWKKTKMAEHLCPKGVEKFEDIPLTTYEDYPILHKFGEEIEKLEKAVPRRKGELWRDYYDRISKQVAPMLEGWMADEYAFCAKTSGTTGEPKWFAHGETFLKNMTMDLLAAISISASDNWGETKLRPGDKLLNIMAPAPYVAGTVAVEVFAPVLKLVPPIEIIDNITDMRKKINITIKLIKAGEKLDVIGGIASPLKMICDYFKRPDELYKNYYQSMNFGIAKLILYFIYLRYKLAHKKPIRLKDIFSLKGVGAAGTEAKLYFNYLRDEFGIEPTQVYGSTELGFPFLGLPDRKGYLTPSPRSCYFEFLTDDGKIKRINELEKDSLYELVGTPFGSVLIRYQTGDLFRVIDFREDGLPIFDCEGKKAALLDFFGYFRISEAAITNTIVKAGLPSFDRWCIQKVTEPKEHICVLMEKGWDYTEKEAEEKIFEALREVLPDFQNYVRDFRVKDPSEIIKVEYLSKGAFMRYAMKKVKEGVPLGQIKFRKIIPTDKSEMAELLRRV